MAPVTVSTSGSGGSGFGLDPGQIPGTPTMITPQPAQRFTALDGLRGLAVPFVLAFAVREDIAHLDAPDPVQYLADGGYVLVALFFVLVGFLLCRPLNVLVGAGTGSGRLLTAILRRVAPLHVAAWTITFGWLATGASPGTAWGWLSSGLLLNGVTGPERSGYPVSWSVSMALVCAVGLIGLARLLGHRHRDAPAVTAAPGPVITYLAVTTGLIGISLLLRSGPDAAGTLGIGALGQGLLGLAAGMLCYRVLEGATGTVRAPMPGSSPAPQAARGLGAMLALAALLLCVYRSDLVYELDLLPVFPVAAALVYFVALPNHTRPGLVNRFLDSGPLQWLGTRALALYLLHGPVQITVERICELRGVDRAATSTSYAVIGTVLIGSLLAAELGHRLLEHLLSPRPAPAPEPVSVYLQPRTRTRPERIAQIDPRTIPSELRLKPLPSKAAAVPASVPTPVIPAQPFAPEIPVIPSVPVEPPEPVVPEDPKPAARKPAAKPARKPAPRKAAPTAIQLPADKAVDKPARKTPARKTTKQPAPAAAAAQTDLTQTDLTQTDTSIDLDQPTKTPPPPPR